MLGKLIGTILGLALAAFGGALMGGWVTPADFDSESGRFRTVPIKNAVQWLHDTLGAMGGGGALLGLGLLVLLVTLKKKKGGGDKH